MATVTRPYKPQPAPAPAPAAAEPQPAPEAPVPDAARPYFGDRIAFAVWLICALFMGALLTYDTVMGLFR
jgi:hypothetical protein